MPPPNPAEDRKLEIAHRLREARQKLLISQTLFAVKVEISQSRLARYELARDPLPWLIGEKLCLMFGINPLWLATGKGEMFGTSPEVGAMLRHPRGARPHFAVVIDEALEQTEREKALLPRVPKSQRTGPSGSDFPTYALGAEMSAIHRVLTRKQAKAWSKLTNEDLRAAYATVADREVDQFTDLLRRLLSGAQSRHRRSRGA